MLNVQPQQTAWERLWDHPWKLSRCETATHSIPGLGIVTASVQCCKAHRRIQKLHNEPQEGFISAPQHPLPGAMVEVPLEVPTSGTPLLSDRALLAAKRVNCLAMAAINASVCAVTAVIFANLKYYQFI